jgi:glyoxylase-like metal-dependent hydrolase (beta-lactamase superfamily II)
MGSEVLQRTTEKSGSGQQVVPDVVCFRVLIANLCFVGDPGARTGEWVLVDAGVPFSANRILQAAEERFGPASRPKAIVLTHGHFDHVGAVIQLTERWDVPVYAHELEMPYLTDQSDYPPPDPTVGGGLMAWMAPLYPRRSINLGDRVRSLPADGSIPPMPGWRWIHTPGHTAGHVSLFRDDDRVLIAGDAFTTVKQESALAVLTQHMRVHGPPAYFTTDWKTAWESVKRLEALNPSVAATGHGLPMRGEQLARQLEALARDFNRIAVPANGRYVRKPAVTNAHGVVEIPPPVSNPLPKVLAGLGIAALVGVAVAVFLSAAT